MSNGGGRVGYVRTDGQVTPTSLEASGHATAPGRLTVGRGDRYLLSTMRSVLYLVILAAASALPGQPIEVCKAEADQRHPAIAAGGEQFLVAWQDSRDLAVDSSCNTYGCRLSRSGVVLDSSGVQLGRSRRDQYYPRAAWGGDNWLVVWQEGC